MRNKHLFILSPIADLKIDTSVQIAHALHRRGDEIYVTHISQLFIDTARTGATGAMCNYRRASFSSTSYLSYAVGGETRTCPLANFSAVHMRVDPPLVLSYIAATWCLDLAHTTVFNHPRALRDYNEKMAICHFPDRCVRTLVSADCEHITEFVCTKLAGNAVIKPLEQFGGRGVYRLQGKDKTRIAERIGQSLQEHRSPLIVQEFHEEVFRGEVRAFCVFGEPIAWCLKHPAHGDFRANTAHGATLAPHTPSPAEIETATHVAQRLLQDGIYFVGFDMLAGKVSEINLTSPRLLRSPRDADPYPAIAARISEFLKNNSPPNSL